MLPTAEARYIASMPEQILICDSESFIITTRSSYQLDVKCINALQ